jgi:predicted acyl esterase
MRLRQDLRWRGKQAMDEALARVVIPRVKVPGDVAPRYARVHRLEAMVPMRDGVRLATDVYLPYDPVDGGPQPTQTGLPAIVERQPYGKRGAFLAMGALGPYYAKRGYAFVVQDIRGRWASEGEYDPFVHESDDGYDTLEWVARQPWCDGRIGAAGESYFGYTTWAMAVTGHPALRAAIPGETATDMYTAAFRNGAHCLNPFGIWAFWVNGKRFGNYYRVDPYTLPLSTLDEASGLGGKQWKMLLEHFPRDDYWASLDLTEKAKQIEVPVMQWSGWYDQFLDPTIRLWRELRARREDQFLVLPPLDHLTSPERTGRIGQTKVADVGTFYDRNIRFFDRFLRGAETEFPSAPVTYFTMGPDEWRTAGEWPPAGTGEIELFLGSDALAPEPPGEPAERRYTYDPADPVAPWVGTEGWAPAQHMKDRAEIGRRGDVVVFDSPPLAADFEVTGPLRVSLFASTSAEDTDFIATLDDVHPGGYVHLVQQGIVRARYRNAGRDEPIEPGSVVEYAIDLWHTSYVVKAGHRLRLELSSSELDRYDRNLNTCEPWATGTTWKVAEQTLHLGGDHPSRLLLWGPRAPRFAA